MTPEEIQAANLQLNFDGVEEAEGSNMTEPGMITIFKIIEGEFISSKEKGTPGIKLTFVEKDGSSFTHNFWLTAKALGRIKHLAKYAANATLSGQILPSQIIAMVKDKKLPLKITAQINTQNGRVYPDLPFGGFSAEKVEDLTFTAKENEEIAKGKALASENHVSNSDTETPTAGAPAATPGTQDEADDF